MLLEANPQEALLTPEIIIISDDVQLGGCETGNKYSYKKQEQNF